MRSLKVFKASECMPLAYREKFEAAEESSYGILSCIVIMHTVGFDTVLDLVMRNMVHRTQRRNAQ